MKNVKKKLFSVVVATSLLSTQTLQAFDLKEDFLGNVTGSGVYSDDFTQSKYMYGGSIVYKFKNNSMSNAPLFAFEAPKIKAGCNGVSITGGFMQVLGLDGLSDQLRNSSTAIVYGIIIGLIYSTPAISQALDKVRAIANWLQKFNQDACNIGKTIGSNLAKNSGMAAVDEKGANLINGLIEEGNEKVNEFLGEIGKIPPEEVKNFVKDMLKTDNPENKNANAKAYAKEYEPYFKTMGLAGLILKQELLPSSQESIDIEMELIVPTTPTKELYLLVHELFGDIGFNKEAIEFLEKNKTTITELVKNGKTEDESVLEKEAINVAANLKDKNTVPFFPVDKATRSFGPLPAKQKINLLLYGNKIGPGTPPQNLTVSDVYTLKGKLKTYGTTNTKEILSYAGTASSTSTIEWDGLIALSKDHIECALSYVKGDEATCTDFPIVYSKFTQYLNTIKDVESKISTISSETAAASVVSSYKDILARYNGVKISQALLSTIEEEIRGYQRKGLHDDSINKMIKDIAAMNIVLDEELNKLVAEQKDIKTIDDIFIDLKQELTKDKLQGN